MILDRQDKAWRATFTSSGDGVPRVEVFHGDWRRAFRIASDCERFVHKKFPEDFPSEGLSFKDQMKGSLLLLAGFAFFTAQLAVGASALLSSFGFL